MFRIHVETTITINNMEVKTLKTLTAAITLLFAVTVTSAPKADQLGSSSSDNCDVNGVDYEDDLYLTRAERLEMMEQAFYESLNKFEDCNLSSKSGSSSSSSQSTNAGMKQSMASDELEGTEINIIEDESVSANSDAENDSGTGSFGPLATPGNGKIPEDIPPAENDDAIAAQIRLAAESESNPDIREKLWNEYRKYKGIKSE